MTVRAVVGEFCDVVWATCAACGQRYIRQPAQADARCSSACRAASANVAEVRRCAYRGCGHLFPVRSKSIRQKFCTDLCNAKAWVARHERRRPRRQVKYETRIEARLAHIAACRARPRHHERRRSSRPASTCTALPATPVAASPVGSYLVGVVAYALLYGDRAVGR